MSDPTCACPQCRMGEPHDEAPVSADSAAAKVRLRIAELSGVSRGASARVDGEVDGLRFALQAITGVAP